MTIERDKEIEAIVRRVVREELDTARDIGFILSEDERHFVREWIQSASDRHAFVNDVLKKTLVWGVLAAIGGTALAIWEFLKDRVNT